MPALPAAKRHRQRAAERARLGAIGLVAVLTLGACGSVAPSGPSSSAPSSAPASASPAPSASVPPSGSPSGTPAASDMPSASAAQAQRLLEVHSEGGFINPAASLGALPTVVVDIDGRIYAPAVAQDAPSMIPGVTVRDFGAAGASAILTAAKAVGLVDGTAGGGGVVADTGSTVFTLETGGNEVVTRIAGGGGPVGGPGGPGVHPGDSGSGPGGSMTPAAAALAFLAKLVDPAVNWGGAAATEAVYEPTAYRVWVAPIAAGGTGGTAAAWPLTADPNTFGAPAAASFGVDGLRSGVVSGRDAGAVAQALATVPAGSTLSFGGHAYQIWIRPLLPDELGG